MLPKRLSMRLVLRPSEGKGEYDPPDSLVAQSLCAGSKRICLRERSLYVRGYCRLAGGGLEGVMLTDVRRSCHNEMGVDRNSAELANPQVGFRRAVR